MLHVKPVSQCSGEELIWIELALKVGGALMLHERHVPNAVKMNSCAERMPKGGSWKISVYQFRLAMQLTTVSK